MGFRSPPTDCVWKSQLTAASDEYTTFISLAMLSGWGRGVGCIFALYATLSVASVPHEVFQEELVIRPLEDGRVASKFSFTTTLKGVLPRHPETLDTDDDCERLMINYEYESLNETNRQPNTILFSLWHLAKSYGSMPLPRCISLSMPANGITIGGATRTSPGSELEQSYGRGWVMEDPFRECPCHVFSDDIEF